MKPSAQLRRDEYTCRILRKKVRGVDISNAAIYARVSSKAQDDAIQLADLQGFVQRWGWHPVVYEDKLKGKEGYRRPCCERLLADAPRQV
jgi:hypothetical protein